MSSLNWWLNYDKLNDLEKEILNIQRPDSKYNKLDYNTLQNELFSYLLCDDTSNFSLELEECATNFINKLFDHYVDDNTLIIRSSCEHENVRKKSSEFKNELVLDFYKDIKSFNIDYIIKESKKYNKVFIYIIGTQVSTGEITPQSFFIKLIEKLKSNNIKYKLVLDDVQGMFLVPRDYNIFDYIIGTAHSMVRGFDMGMLIKNSQTDIFGIRANNWLFNYLKLLKVLINRREKLLMFRSVIEQEFDRLLSLDNFSLVSRSSPNIVCIKTKDINFNKEIHDILEEYEIKLEGWDLPVSFIRFRAQQFIKRPDLLINGLNLLNLYLEEVL